ncbi:MAG TPA: SDR family oxidoreductase [Myxococcota bacterium]|nr:SDR family oxidoreductase [Myxococcota bacterium]
MRAEPLSSRVALVTGVSRRAGIGFAIAKRLASLGADLCLHAFAPYDARQAWGADRDGPEALAKEVAALGVRVESLSSDLAEADAPERLVAEAWSRLGRVDVVVANHTHSRSGGLEELRAEEIDRQLAVNVRATLLLVQAFAARHDGRAGGRVVLLTSGQDRGPMTRELAYAASKGALASLVTSLSAHLAHRGITVNAVNPGATDTGWASPELHEEILSREPQGRWGAPDDAARLVAWLATDDARWVTGQVIHSTGGGP